jgi:hypothetical protein
MLNFNENKVTINLFRFENFQPSDIKTKLFVLFLFQFEWQGLKAY